MSDIAIARTVVLVILAAALLALFISLIRREWDNVLRSVIFALIFAGLFVFFQHTKMEHLTIAELKKELGLAKAPEYVFIKEEGQDLYKQTVRYFFPEPGPRLNLTIDESGRYLHLDKIDEINRVLDYLGLKKVTHGVKELASLTGSQLDVNLYRWDDYPDGILTIERAICRDKRTFNSYNCLQSITLTRWR
jgi:hypothetical protein